MNDERKVVPIIGEHHEGDKAVPLTTTATDVRSAAQALFAKAETIRRVLSAPACHDAMRARAKDDLVKLSKDALALWSIV
jgi:hypothetical protein